MMRIGLLLLMYSVLDVIPCQTSVICFSSCITLNSYNMGLVVSGRGEMILCPIISFRQLLYMNGKRWEIIL